ncbi:MAG: NAD(P)/FAD-dependent oxidoreductase [Sedimentitalea sp.]
MTSPAHPVVVIGGGIVGICCALSLIETGTPTVLIEPDDPGQGASFGNAGIISPWSVVPQSSPGIWKKVPGWLLKRDGPASVSPAYALRLLPWLAAFLRAGTPHRVSEISKAMQLLNQDNIALYRTHLAGTGHEDLIADSYYVHAYRNAAEARPEAPEYAARAALGAPIERIDAAELRALEPALSHDFQAAILIKNQARARDPGQIATVLAEKFQSLGGQIMRAKVMSLQRETRWTITTDRGTVNAEKIVLSAGIWSADLLKPLGVKIPLASERGYHIACPTPGVSLTHSVMDVQAKFVASSMTMGLRAAGTAEFAPPNAPANPARSNSILRALRRMIPDIDTTDHTSWMGVRPSTPDSLPVIGATSQYPGLFMAFGHSHYGLMMAPKTGRVIADLVRDVRSNQNLTLLSPSRFS